MSSTVTSEGCEMTTTSISVDFDNSTATFAMKDKWSGELKNDGES